MKDIRLKNICTLLPVLVPENAPDDLVLKILAAVTSYSLGVKSLAQLEAGEQDKEGGMVH